MGFSFRCKIIVKKFAYVIYFLYICIKLKIMKTHKIKLKVVNCPGDMEEDVDWSKNYNGSISEINLEYEESPLFDKPIKRKVLESYKIDFIDFRKNERGL